MKVQKKERTDNPLTDHSDEPDSVDIVTKADKPDEDPKEVVLSTEPPEKDDDETTEPDGSVWRAKKRARKQQYDDMQAQLEQERTARQEAEARAHALWAAQQVQQQPQRQTDPLEEEEKTLKAEWDKHIALGNTLQKGSTPEQAKQWQDDHYALQRRGQSLSAKRELQAAGLAPGQRVNFQEESLKAQLQSEYSDIVGNQRYIFYADGLAKQRAAERGRGLTKAELDDVMEATRRAFRLPTARTAPPSADIRQKFSGTGLGGASGASNGNGTSQIRMNEDMMAMAEAKYTRERDPRTGQWRKLSKSEAHAKWAQNEGKRVAEKYR